MYQGRDWARVIVTLLLLWVGAQLLLSGMAVTFILGGLHVVAAALLFTPSVSTYVAYARQQSPLVPPEITARLRYSVSDVGRAPPCS